MLSLLLGSIWTTSAFSEVDITADDYGSENISEGTKNTPFSFDTYIDAIGSAKIKKGYYKGDKVDFAIANADLGMIVYYCPAYEEGARVSLSFNANYLDWHESPWITQDHFYTASLNLGAFTKRYDRWLWRGQLSINVDACQWSSDYVSYDTLLWGRYSYNECSGLHIGILALTGLDMVWIYPIVGFDWQISQDWKLNVVYPMNISLEYALNKCWTLAVASRNFDVRHRVEPHESYSKSLVRYRNSGAEFLVKYHFDKITANLHAGVTFNGRYRIANRHNHNAHTYRLDSAGYAGGEIEVSF